MEIKDILKKQCKGIYIGYQLQTIAISLLTRADIIRQFGLKPMKRISKKISYFLHRDKIKEVFYCKYAKDWRDNYYLVIATDGTVFHLEY